MTFFASRCALSPRHHLKQKNKITYHLQVLRPLPPLQQRLRVSLRGGRLACAHRLRPAASSNRHLRYSSSQSCDYDATHPSKRVGIIGGGVGGMALALALRRRGVPCRVFEKDPCAHARSQGRWNGVDDVSRVSVVCVSVEGGYADEVYSLTKPVGGKLCVCV